MPTRAIGIAGTAARAVVGAVPLGSVLAGELTRGWRHAAWVLALLVFPAAALGAAWLRARRHPDGLRATGPAGHVVNCAVFMALYLLGRDDQVGCVLFAPVDAIERRLRRSLPGRSTTVRSFKRSFISNGVGCTR